MRAKDFDRDEFLSTTWPEALEGGEFEQGKSLLVDNTSSRYCCLGVACELLSRLRLLPRRTWVGHLTLPRRAMELIGIDETGSYKKPRSKSKHSELTSDNDSGKSFKTIAKTIRRLHERELFETAD